MDHGIVRVSAGVREIVLVGTAHVSRASVEDVRGIIASEKPDRVCVELDEGRYASLVKGSTWHELDIGKVIREGKGFLLLSNLVLSSFQRRLGADLGVKPGEEMLAAIQAAQELGIPYSLCDRDIQITLRRAWSKTGAWGKSKMLAAMISSVFSDEKLGPEEIEKLKEKDILASMMEELAGFLPAAKEVLIDERDRYLAVKIMQAEGRKLVAVVGAGHLSGITRHIEELSKSEVKQDLAPLNELPKKAWAAKILPWAIPALLVGIFALGFFKSGWQLSLELALKWLIANGGLAAIGSLIALAHPVTIAIAFLGAPIATLNPFIGIGMFTGMAEAFLRKPRVQDFERLQDDVTSIRGFYRNRVTRILLVFFLSSIGGMIGNFIAIPWITALLSGK